MERRCRHVERAGVMTARPAYVTLTRNKLHLSRFCNLRTNGYAEVRLVLRHSWQIHGLL